MRLLSTLAAISLILGAGLALPAAAQTPERYMDAAKRMLDEADLSSPSLRLLRLQLSAEDYVAAEQTAVALADGLRPTQQTRASAVLPWRIFARARGYETGLGMTKAAALERAFSELFVALPDREMAAALPGFGANLGQLQDRAQQAEAACAGITLTDCPTGIEAVTARQSAEVWGYLLPASEALIRRDVERRFIVQDDILVDTPDGASIAVMVVRPRGDGLTALLNFGIYNRSDWSFPDAVQMAAHGYAGAVGYTRGKGRGTGDPVPYIHDGADAAAVIDWLAIQPWSDGRVGMFSGSYNSFTQWAALKHRPAALKAIATNASNAPGIDTPMQDGVFLNFIYPWPLYVASGSELDETTYGDTARWDTLFRDWFIEGRPYRELDRMDGRANPVFRSWLEHPDYDSFWQALIPQGGEFADVDIPVYVQTGYFDGGMVGALHYMREHLKHRPDADHRMIVGPYHHTAQQGGVQPSINGYDLDPSAMVDLAALRMQWFDHVFRGAPLPELLSDRVNFQVMGGNIWRHVPSPDAMAPERMRLHLRGETSPGVRALAEEVSDAESLLTVDMADRSGVDRPFIAGELDTTGALMFETAPFPDGLEVAGTFTGQLEIITNKRDLDLEVTFFEHLEDGGWFRLASYLGRASYMEDRSRRQLLDPGVPQTLAFESQMMTAVRLDPGSTIVALVGVPFRPDVQINYGTGGDVSDETIADAAEPMTIRLLPGSWLELGVRRGED